MNRALQIFRALRRPLTQTRKPLSTEVVDKRAYRIKKVQKHYSEDDCNPVWLKMGARDKILYYGTLLMMAYGMGDSVYVLVLLSLPK